MVLQIMVVLFFLFVVCGLFSLLYIELISFLQKFIPEKLKRIQKQRCPHCSRGHLIETVVEIDGAMAVGYECSSCYDKFI